MMLVPTFDGHASSFANYEENVISRNQISTLDPQKRAANLLLHVSDIARKVCVPVGKDSVGNADGVALILRISRGRFAPEAIDSIFQDMVKISHFKRTG